MIVIASLANYESYWRFISIFHLQPFDPDHKGETTRNWTITCGIFFGINISRSDRTILVSGLAIYLMQSVLNLVKEKALWSFISNLDHYLHLDYWIIISRYYYMPDQHSFHKVHASINSNWQAKVAADKFTRLYVRPLCAINGSVWQLSFCCSRGY